MPNFYNQEEDIDDEETFFDRHDVPTFIMIGAFLGFVIGYMSAMLIIG